MFVRDSTSWGIQHEPHALKLYKRAEKKKHKNLKVRACGLYILTELPIIGASPDGIVECDCCAARCLEIKCPWTFRGLTIAEFAAEKETYLIPHGTDFIVDPSHQYYAQIQCQMAVTGSLSCDFFVCTVKEYHLSRVAFDQIFWHHQAIRSSFVREVGGRGGSL